MKETSGERERAEPPGALSRPDRLKPVPADLSLSSRRRLHGAPPRDPRVARGVIYDPWHYLPVLVKKPGALRNGAPFKEWSLPTALAQVRAKLKSHPDGDRQFVKVLGAVPDYGLAAVEAACAEALQAGIANGDVILTVLARRLQPAAAPSIITPDALRLKIEPMADCGRYDSIRKEA